MAVPQSVLVAVDFGDASARAVALGGLIAERCHAKTLRLMHADSFDAPIYFTSEQLDRLERERHMLKRQAEVFLTQFGRQHTAVPFSIRVGPLPPADLILQESTGFDVVVMGTHGRHGPKRWWLGSVAERVLRDTSRPLLIVRAGSERPLSSMFDRAMFHAGPPLAGTATLRFGRDLVACLGGQMLDTRHESFEAAVERHDATIVIVSVPEPRTAAWLSDVGEPLVRSSSVPILFIPEVEGASP
jgi:nucleotide-binding universal stress UspA family protein